MIENVQAYMHIHIYIYIHVRTNTGRYDSISIFTLLIFDIHLNINFNLSSATCIAFQGLNGAEPPSEGAALLHLPLELQALPDLQIGHALQHLQRKTNGAAGGKGCSLGEWELDSLGIYKYIYIHI